MTPPKQGHAGPSSSSPNDNPSRPRPGPLHGISSRSANSSAETVIHRPQARQENVRPNSTPTVFISRGNGPNRGAEIGVPSAIPLVVGYPIRDPYINSFDTSIPQEANWPTPEPIKHLVEYQGNRHNRDSGPRVASFAQQSQTANRVFDPEHGSIYGHCTDCSVEGGPTDCQHPKDPRYSTDLNPIREEDPAFKYWQRLPPLPPPPPPGKKLISKPSTSKASVVTDTASTNTRWCSNPAAPSKKFPGPSTPSRPSQIFPKHSGFKKAVQSPPNHPNDEMLAARPLCKFLTENVDADIASSYIVFAEHGNLLGYSEPLATKNARSTAAITSLTWRANARIFARDPKGEPMPANPHLKTIKLSGAERVPGLYNMVCEHNGLLMAVQWLKQGFLFAAMIEQDPPPPPPTETAFELGAQGTEGDDRDSVWTNEDVISENSEDEEERFKRANQPSKQEKLVAKSQGLAKALRVQFDMDNLDKPTGFS